MIRELARKRRLRTRRQGDGELIITGRHGHLYEYGPGVMGACFTAGPSQEPLTELKWGNRRRACVKGGMKLIQDGDFEGTLLFNPKNKQQLDLALKWIGVHRKKSISSKELARLRELSRLHGFSAAKR